MQCDKNAYPNYKLANNAVVAMNKQRKHKYTSYKCNECGEFHIATINKHSLPKPIKGKATKERFSKTSSETLHLPTNINRNKVREQPIHTTGKLLSPAQAQFLKQLIQNRP
jgi:hypothetical protein